MSSLFSIKLSQICTRKPGVMCTTVRNHWNKDFKPFAFPQNDQDRLMAAKKYGIVPKEYKPYPDDGTGLGDYPLLPESSGDSRDINYPWDNPELKRNFEEPMHADFDLMGEDRYDVNFRHRIPVFKQFVQFCGVMFGTFGLYYILENSKMFPGLVPKQYPFQGKNHYTFESK